VRDNCPHAYLFAVTPDSARVLREVYGTEAESCPKLGQYEFFEIHPFSPTIRRKLSLTAKR
jgi:hypothetical protein